MQRVVSKERTTAASLSGNVIDIRTEIMPWIRRRATAYILPNLPKLDMSSNIIINKETLSVKMLYGSTILLFLQLFRCQSCNSIFHVVGKSWLKRFFLCCVKWVVVIF